MPGKAILAKTFSPSSSQTVASPSETRPSQNFSFSLSTLLLLMTLASVCLGLITIYPGLGVPVCVLLVPALMRTARVVQHRKAIGMPVSNAQKAGLLLASFGVATILTMVTIVTAFSSACGVLLIVFYGMEGGGNDLLIWGIGMCAFAVAMITLTLALIKWNHRRYRREMDRDWVNRNFMQNKPPSDGANGRGTG